MKRLSEIAWNVTEEEYRQDLALSYSTLAKYEREGFNKLDHLFDKVETPSLTFGSAVDAIITGGQEEFDSRFIVTNMPNISDSILKMIKVLYARYSDIYKRIEDIPDTEIIEVSKELSYQLNWKPETRARVIKEQGSEYYAIMTVSEGKTILSEETAQQVFNAVRALKENESTKWYFQEDNSFDNIERYYQLKFKANFNGVNYRCMMDLAIVLHDQKLIIPCDLKTSSHTEWDFPQSFIDWMYMIQARLYWKILRYNMDKDGYFKDFKLADYVFIVVNKHTLTPLTWEYKDTALEGTLYYGKNKQIVIRDPLEIGTELKGYLDSRPKVPNGINLIDTNDLITYLNKL